LDTDGKEKKKRALFEKKGKGGLTRRASGHGGTGEIARLVVQKSYPGKTEVRAPEGGGRGDGLANNPGGEQ